MKKKKQKIWIILLCLWLLPVLFPAAVYAYAPAGNSGRIRVSERQEQFQVTLNCGWKGMGRRSGEVPAKITIVNSGPEFKGTLRIEIPTQSNNGNDIVTRFFEQLFVRVRSADSERSQNFIYEIPVVLGQKETVTKSFTLSLVEYMETAVKISLADTSGKTVYASQEKVSVTDPSGSRITVGILESEEECASEIDGMKIGEMEYQLRAVSLKPEDLTAEMAVAGQPDLLIFLDQSREALDEKQKENVKRWEAAGGIVIDFWESDFSPEIMRKIFCADPEQMMQILLTQKVLSKIPSISGYYYNVDYESSWLLEGKAIRKQPNSILFLGLIFGYAVLAGPILYFALKKRKKRRYLWPAICMLSVAFVVVIAVLGNQTVMKAPVIVYKNSLFQKENQLEETINFEIQVPYNSGCKVYLDPSYRITPGNQINAMSTELAGTVQEGFEQIQIRYGDSKNEIYLSNQPAFTLNAFTLSRSSALETDGVSADLTWMDGRLSGTVTNHSGYDLEDCVVVLPGHMAYVGELLNGEQRQVEDLTTDSVRDSTEWLEQKLGESDRTKAFCSEAGIRTPNSVEESLLIGVVKGREETFQLYSGYEMQGETFYTSGIRVSSTGDDGTVYCPYAQKYYATEQQSFEYGRYPGSLIMDGRQMEVTYYLNAVYEDSLFGVSGISELFSEIFPSADLSEEEISMNLEYLRILMQDPGEHLTLKNGTVEQVEFRNPDVLAEGWEAFDGTIEVYNYGTGAYEKLEDWKLQDNSGRYRIPSPYLANGNQLTVRFTLSDQAVSSEYYKKMGAYQMPDLIVKMAGGKV